MRHPLPSALFCLLLAPALLPAEVADSSAAGFTVKIAVTVKAPPEAAARRLVRNIGDWWSSEHTFSGDARNLSIEERPAGCFCEKLPGGGGVRHMEVVTWMPGKMLVMQGALGPLQTMGAAGAMSIQFSPAEGGAKVEIVYQVGGYSPQGWTALAPLVDKVLTEQFTRYQRYVSEGPAAK